MRDSLTPFRRFGGGCQQYRLHFAFLLRPLFCYRNVPKHLREIIEDLEANIRMCKLPSAKTYVELDFIAVGQEAPSLIALHLDVMIVSIRLQPNLLDLDNFLVLTCFALFFRLIVAELAVVHEPADRWVGVRRYFYQIQATLFS